MGQIYCDMGTVYLSCKDYKKSHEYLDKSFKFSPADNPQRNYVLTVLCAAEGKIVDARKLVDNLPDHLKAYCQQIIGYN